ncbi:unnamed protein product [Discula destructiva]
MANYTRRAQNDISQFLREGNLNSVHASEPQEDFTLADGELDVFMTKEFIDFDTGLPTDFKADSPPATKPGEPASAASVLGDYGNIDYMNTAGDFGFDYNNTFASPINTAFPDGLQSLQPSPHSVYPPVSHAHAFGHHGGAAQPKTGEKRRATEPQPAHVHNRALSIEEASRVAAEEDKRRRNTAASARFRVKKKQREAALEKSAKEMNDKVSALEQKISQLETENQWLKKLILEKNNDTNANAAKEDKPKAANAKDTKDEITVKEVDAKSEKSS